MPKITPNGEWNRSQTEIDMVMADLNNNFLPEDKYRLRLLIAKRRLEKRRRQRIKFLQSRGVIKSYPPAKKGRPIKPIPTWEEIKANPLILYSDNDRKYIANQK
jgi:3'-phosphoadenosine 5'-phosphosulfate sulfotransferase (PAPS reductase)/FAD synthetase